MSSIKDVRTMVRAMGLSKYDACGRGEGILRQMRTSAKKIKNVKLKRIIEKIIINGDDLQITVLIT